MYFFKKIKRKKRKKMFIDTKWIVIIFTAVMIIFSVKLAMQMKIEHNVTESYPSFDENVQRYHSTKEIIFKTITDNNLNPFYTWMDLTQQIPDKELKIIGYGPLDEPADIPVRIMIVCGQHGRERISSEICFNMIRLLQLQIRDDLFTVSIENATIQGIGLWVVPVLNPWARAQAENNLEDQCRRTNKNGVDLNRNFPKIPIALDSQSSFRTMFSNFSDNEHGHPEDYDGPSELSEYESTAIAEYIDYVKPHILINVHSGGNDILLPYDCETDQLPKHYNIMVKLANFARRTTCPECKIGISSMILYPSLGTLVDYAVYFRGVQLAYTLEIYDSKAVQNDHQLSPDECLTFFNPLTPEDIASVNKKWITFIIAIIQRLPFEIVSSS